MVRYSSVVGGLFIVLLSSLKAMMPCAFENHITIESTSAVSGRSAASEDDHLQSSKCDHSSYEIKVKKKIVKRFRAQYCDYLFLPPGKILHYFYVADKITYTQPGYYFSKWAHFSFKLRGPPAFFHTS